jgi:tetratricopeptide (TPR) repeat protein
MINLVADTRVPGMARPDPEAQAGRALRRLRLSHGWSQEEVARRMHAFGYDFHQTMIAKIEAAQRPLRVRELADFAALYSVEVHELIYPPNGSLEEIDQLITTTEEQRLAARRQAEMIEIRLHKAQSELAAIQNEYEECRRTVIMLEDRLEYLHYEKAKFARFEADDPTAPNELAEPIHSGGARTTQQALTDLDHAIELNPGSATAFATRADIFRQLGRYEEALTSIDHAIELNPGSATAFATRADIFRQLGRYEEALTSIDHAIKLNPGSATAFATRADIFRQLGRHEEALTSIDHAIKLNHDGHHPQEVNNRTSSTNA